MPNWCENRVSIHGDKKTVKSFIKEAIKDEKFQFKNLIPMPEDLRDTTSGFMGKGTPEQEELEERQTKNLRKYGYKDWYDWANDVWGTKWDVDVEVDYVGDDCIQMNFDTAWGPPVGVYNYISTAYPDLTVSWFFDEPGCEVAGYLNNEILKYEV
jgi:hypothetical protein